MKVAELMEALQKVDAESEVRVALEGDVDEHPIVNVLIEAGEAVIEFREEN